jgi:hypothetical protein
MEEAKISQIFFPSNTKVNATWPHAVLTAYFLTNFNALLSQHSSLFLAL